MLLLGGLNFYVAFFVTVLAHEVEAAIVNTGCRAAIELFMGDDGINSELFDVFIHRSRVETSNVG